MTAAEVRAARKRLRMTQAELAYHLGVAPATVYRWERGDASPPEMLRLALERLQETGAPRR